MSVIFTLSMKLLILLSTGAWCCKKKILDEQTIQKLSKLLLQVSLPAGMLASSQQDFSMDHLGKMCQVAGIAAAYYILMGVIGIFSQKRRQRNDQAIRILLWTFANTAFLGMPLLTEIAGETGFLYAVIYNCVFDIFYFSLGIGLLEKEKAHSEKRSMWELFQDPMTKIAVLTVVLYVIPWRAPGLLVESLEGLGNLMMPLSMLIIGAQVSEMKLVGILKERSGYLLCMFRMLIIPAITFLVMYLAGADKTVTATVVLLAAMPSGSLNVIMAQKYQSNVRLATATVMQSTVLMFVTLPIFLMLLMQ